jgi:hypothetical protein
MLLGLLMLASASTARAEEVLVPEPPRWHVMVAGGPLVGTQRYYNSGGLAGQVRGGWRATRTIGIEALASVAYLSGGEGRAWAQPFEPELALGSLRVGPRWGLALGASEISASLHAGYMSAGPDAHGVAVDLGAAFELGLTDTIRAGLFASGIAAANGNDGPGTGLYVEAGPFIRVLLSN